MYYGLNKMVDILQTTIWKASYWTHSQYPAWYDCDKLEGIMMPRNP